MLASEWQGVHEVGAGGGATDQQCLEDLTTRSAEFGVAETFARACAFEAWWCVGANVQNITTRAIGSRRSCLSEK